MEKWTGGQVNLMGRQANGWMDGWRDETEGCCFSSAETPSPPYHLCDLDVQFSLPAPGGCRGTVGACSSPSLWSQSPFSSGMS